MVNCEKINDTAQYPEIYNRGQKRLLSSDIEPEPWHASDIVSFIDPMKLHLVTPKSNQRLGSYFPRCFYNKLNSQSMGIVATVTRFYLF